MSQSSDSNIKDISKETAPKPIEDILQPAANPESEEKSDEGVLSKISSAADSLMNKITGNNTESTDKTNEPVVAAVAEAPVAEGSSGEEKEEMPAVLDISKESAAAVQEEKEVVLKLGDIIYILDSTNEILNENTFVINYIDPTKIKLINTKSFEPTQLNVKENGAIGNGTITEIKILSRNPKEGFARQNDLLPGKWVNIYFGGDYPAVITAEITNLEEDMIELRTTEDDTIYINFAYQGIPENLPIETFEIRPAPEGSQGKEKDKGLEGEREELEEGEIIEFGDEPEPEPEDTMVSKREVRDKIKQFLIEGDQIIFGDVVQIQEFVNIDKDKYRYNIETQTNDLLEEMVSTIPSARRTPSVLNSIHIMITRFLQLRELSSQFDVNKNITGIVKKTADDRPLAEYLSKFQNSLYWIMLAAKNVKKIYTSETKENENDILFIKQNDDLLELSTLFKNYRANASGEGQNKYSELYSSLNPYMTPFETLPIDTTDTVFTSANGVIVNGNVTSNINVIIDNLTELYSSIVNNDQITTRKFVIEKYNLGLDRLEATNFKGGRMIAHRVKLTPNDNISVNSILTLPEPTVRFSQINLPGSDLLVKASLNLNFLNYWQLLKQKTSYSKVDINELEIELEYENDNFVDDIKNYVLDLSTFERPEGITNMDIYEHFLKIIIPKIRVIFNLVKKYIKGKLSMVNLINYLEPFLVYSNDLTYKQYIDFNAFIQQKIGEYNKTYVDYSRAFASLKNMNIKNKYSNEFFQILDDNPEIKAIVFEVYDLDVSKIYSMTTSELLKKITLDDYGNLFNNAVALSNLELMYPDELKSIFEADKESLKAQMEKNAAADSCTSYVIAKKYYSLDRLEADNGQDIYFDKDFDNTNYDLIDVTYKKERDTLNGEEMVIFLTDQLTKKFKKDERTAAYMAETLVNRAKKVSNGQYAMLVDSSSDTSELKGIEYYIRKDDEWSKVKEVDPNWFINSEDLLCNIQTDCLFKPSKTDDNCESVEVTRDSIVSNALKSIMDQFDKNYRMTKDEFQKIVTEKARYYDNIYSRIQQQKMVSLLKYNMQQYDLGLQVLEEQKSTIVSPYVKLRDLIIGQQDFVKKQHDILRFVEMYGRNGNTEMPNVHDGEMESEWWVYCKDTNTKLMPQFRAILAYNFVNARDNYENVLNLLKQDIGGLSDNGDAWVDIHSGEEICPIDADVEEGYKDGFKMKSREILEQEESNVTAANASNKSKQLSPDGQMVFNIIHSIASNMGIKIDQVSDFIIKVVTELMSDIKVIEKESSYREKEKQAAIKGKKLPEYGLVYSSTLMMLTLGMFLIGVQTSVPSIKTRKTFPGCVRSFSGFPFEGEGDDTGLNYLACVAFKMRSKTVPWDSLVRVKEEELANRIKLFTLKFLLPYSEVEQKIKEKVEYLLQNPEIGIPEEHNMAKWTNFLPPLRRFHVKGLQNITSGFNDELLHEIKIGNPKQFEKLLVIESKIISYSMAIQEEIQHIVENKDLLLKSSNHPFMDNACCNDKENSTLTALQYFVKENSNIEVNNNVVRELSKVMNDLKLLTESAIMLSTVDTKRIFPTISTAFSEETIYMAFIDLCKFQSSVPISQELATVCISKPDYLSKNDTLLEKIAKLKREGRNYSKEAFLRLFQIVSRENIIPISLSFNKPSYSDILSKILKKLDETDDQVIHRNFRDKMELLLDTYDVSIQEDIDEQRDMKNYLDRSNSSMRKEIVDFLKRKSKIGKNELKKVITFFGQLTNWESDLSPRRGNSISDDAMYNYINYFKTFVSLMSVVLPTMILNKQIQSIESPSYWGLSQKHAQDLKNMVEKYYEPLKKFYDNNTIKNVLYEIQIKCESIVLLSNQTPALTSVKVGDIDTYSIFDKRMSTLLYEHYTLLVFSEYINLTKDPTMLTRMLVAPESDKDDIFSSDFLVEQQLRFSETEQQFMEGDVVKLQENVASLLVAYATMMMDSKDTIDMSYDTIMDRVFKLKETEKYTFTDRLKNLSEEEREVDTILKINKLGVWSKGLSKSVKEYDPENYDQEKEMTEKIAQVEKNVRRNANVTDQNVDIFLQDALDDMDTDEFINGDEFMMGGPDADDDINGDRDNDDGDGDDNNYAYDD
jgi:hypothetical protein